MDWKTLLAYITGTVDQELLVRNEYLVTENRILRNQITGRVWLSDGERKTLAAIGQKLGKQALKEVANIVTPDTLWLASRRIPMKRGWSRWPGTSRWRSGASCHPASTSSMIGMGNIAQLFNSSSTAHRPDAVPRTAGGAAEILRTRGRLSRPPRIAARHAQASGAYHELSARKPVSPVTR